MESVMLARDLEPVVCWVHGLAFCLGCMIGSFLNVVVWRLPLGMSLLTPPSHCPNCGHQIRPWENIPVLSWLCLRGRCSGCHQPISIRYPLGEMATGALFFCVWLGIYFRNLPLAVLPGYFYLTGVLLSAAQIDMKNRWIPNEVSYSGILVSMLLALLMPVGRLALFQKAPEGVFLVTALQNWLLEVTGSRVFAMPILAAFLDWLTGVLAGVVLLGVLALLGKKVLKKPLVGMGDVKLLAACGGFLGGDAVIMTTLAASVLGVIWGCARMVFCNQKEQSIPFAPFIGVGALAWMCFGNWLFRLVL